MRVVQLLPALNEGGVERGVVELNREYVTRGVESFVISRGGKLAPEIERHGGQHITLDVASKNPITVPLRALQLRRVLHELKPSIVHARSRVPAWLCVFANKRPRFPFVTTVHAMNSVNPYSRVMTFGDRVICVSEVVAAYIQQHYNTAVGRITVIQRGVDLREFDPAKVDAAFVAGFRAQHRLAGRKVILSVGRVTWLKDYESFIDAIGIVRQTRPEVVGMIVGGVQPDKEKYFQELKARVARLGLGENIVFTGSQSRMPEIYSLADVLVNASLKMGNVGRTVAEGLAMNTPVLATTEKGLNNLVRDGVNGFIINTRDAADLAGKMAKALELPRANLRATVPEEFTLDKMVANTLEVYRRLLASVR
ncbi:MAG: glycosyltransferase [Pedosphaera sp.]|nr:glycosyltransferase [Pedosphaera sp.]